MYVPRTRHVLGPMTPPNERSCCTWQQSAFLPGAWARYCVGVLVVQGLEYSGSEAKGFQVGVLGYGGVFEALESRIQGSRVVE